MAQSAHAGFRPPRWPPLIEARAIGLDALEGRPWPGSLPRVAGMLRGSGLPIVFSLLALFHGPFVLLRPAERNMRTDIAPGIFTIAGVLTPEECRHYIEWSEGIGYETAPVSLAGGAVLRPDIRNNARVMVDDPARAGDIWSRIAGNVPPRLEGRRAIGLNERLRFYRYGPGQRFAPHTDGCHRRANGDESLLTLMIYLNGGVRGGETRFDDAVIRPEAGLALLFDHYLMHEGAAVVEGRKYVLRSDVMYGPPA